MTATDQVRYQPHGPLRRIILNRPHAINALTADMVESIDRALREWVDDDSVTGVTIEGAGDKGLCAGGDVVAVRRAVLDGEDFRRFFRSEYAMNSLIDSYPKPRAVLQDGLVLGGGVGVSAHAGLRVVTPRTRMSMPETNIGFFPDVGALFLLSRAPGETGTYAAMSGATMSGADAIHLGLADGMIPQDAWPQLLERLATDPAYHVSMPAQDHLTVPPEPSDLAVQQREWIDECFAGDDAAVIVERLRSHPSPRARAAAERIGQRSALSACVSLEAIRRAASMETVDDVLEQDLRLASAMPCHPDFGEGVRALLVDKDHAPRWAYPSVADVPREVVLALFA